MQRPICLAVVALLLAGTAGPSLAQSAGDGYLFHSPVVTLTVRGGYARASAGSDVFDDVTSNLTLDRGDFSSITGSRQHPMTMSRSTRPSALGRFNKLRTQAAITSVEAKYAKSLDQPTVCCAKS